MANKRGKEAFFEDETFNIEEQQVQAVQEQSTISTTNKYKPNIEFGATQGKKGHKAPRINMAFHPEVHSWIKTRSRQLGISATEFVNRILYEEMKKGE